MKRVLAIGDLAYDSEEIQTPPKRQETQRTAAPPPPPTSTAPIDTRPALADLRPPTDGSRAWLAAVLGVASLIACAAWLASFTRRQREESSP